MTQEWQKRCLEVGFQYWRASDAHGVTATVEQATTLLQDVLGVEVELTPAPIDMVLYCPACHTQHIDAVEDLPMAIPGSAAEGSAGWTNPPHRSHLCHNCGHIWRPADVPTNGVAFIKTAGKHDSPKPSHPDDL